MITQTHRLDVVPGGVTAVVHVKQYQTGESLVFELFSRFGDFEISSAFTDCTVRGTKSDGNGYSALATCDPSNNSVTVQLTEQMTAVAGRQPYEITITESTGRMITTTFVLDVHRAALDADTVESESVIREVDAVVEDYMNEHGLDYVQYPVYPDSKYGTAGQSLRTKGDGTTEWADVGLPTDEQTQEAVNEWLDEHPEATTTVQDGSLTETKFSEALKLKAIKDYVTPQMYGAKADGITNDAVAIQSAIDSGNYVFFPKGDYLIAAPVNIYGKSQWSFNAENANIIYTGNDYAFKYRALRNSVLRFGTIIADNGGCLYFDGAEYSYWSQYNTFYFKVFKAGPNHACVKADQTGDCWINEMRWHSGRVMRGKYGFHLVRTSDGHNMSHWDFHEIGIEGDTNNLIETGFRFESANDGKVIGSFLFDNCRHEEEFTTLIHTTGPVTKMNFITQAGFPYSKIFVDEKATDWEIRCSLYDSLRVINGEIVRVDRFQSLDGGRKITQNTDIKTIIEIGNYYCDKDSDAASLTNCPTVKAFILRIEDRTGSGSHSPNGNYKYYRYILTDAENNEWRMTGKFAPPPGGGASVWTFTDWENQSTSNWVDITDQISWNSSYMTGTNNIKFLYNKKLGLVNVSGDATVTLPQGNTTIGTIDDTYRSKQYYSALAVTYHISNDFDRILYATMSGRHNIAVRSDRAFSGTIMIGGTYVVY